MSHYVQCLINTGDWIKYLIKNWNARQQNTCFAFNHSVKCISVLTISMCTYKLISKFVDAITNSEAEWSILCLNTWIRSYKHKLFAIYDYFD